ncbi:helix-turn-helix domain-containing protein [Amycolatopsis sp. lyj-23]|uniref:helix-turn-helix domain-containing protein n=1 Tax=Amycolatopsis sp. lyj-23 TaxID=2789283 RepID=UPI00397E4A53
MESGWPELDPRIAPGLVPDVQYMPRVAPFRFGLWLQGMCADRDVSVRELAERAGVPLRRLKRVCLGHEPVRSLADVAALADALGVGRDVAALVAVRDYMEGRNGWPQAIRN